MQKTQMPIAKQTLKRIIIERILPQIDQGAFAIKRVLQEKVVVTADIYTEGHDTINATLLYRKVGDAKWMQSLMKHLGNDRWGGEFTIEDEIDYEYRVSAWVNHFETWAKDFRKRIDAGQDVKVDIAIGERIFDNIASQNDDNIAVNCARIVEKIKKESSLKEKQSLLLNEEVLNLSRLTPDQPSMVIDERILKVNVDRKKALFSTWYEFFPRSFGHKGTHGTFKSCEEYLPEIAAMGFDVIYLPPIHPIGKAHRKGKNNARVGNESDPGSSWAIGGKDGGHKAIHAELGTIDDFKAFVKKAKSLGLEIALDVAYQCSPDHPYVKEHPEWFFKRPDGTIQYAENPPKKYEDVYPINFYGAHTSALWNELKSVVDFWIQNGVKIFRVDNPHTKPFAFWEWMIGDVRKEHPDVLFLAEAFTRPKVMSQLAKLGFHQSYTYFTWRTTKWDLTQYIAELTQSESREYFRPNFWPNTPDILPYHLQVGGRPAFISRLVLAATLSSNYGIYGPAYELCVKDAVAGKEEYLDSEKYEIKQWDRNVNGNIKEIIARVNKIRNENPALQTTWNTKFCDVQNDQMIAYYKSTDDYKNIILVIVNLDPFYAQSGMVRVPLGEWNMPFNKSFKVTDLITRDDYTWNGEWNFVELNPYKMPAHIFLIKQVG